MKDMNSRYITIIKQSFTELKGNISRKSAIAISVAQAKLSSLSGVKHALTVVLDAAKEKSRLAFSFASSKSQACFNAAVTKGATFGKTLDTKKKIGIAGLSGISVVAIVVSVVLVSSQLIGVAYNGKVIGYVKNEAQYAALVDEAKEKLSKENGNTEIVFDESSFSTKTEFVVDKDAAKIIDKDDLIDKLASDGNIKASAYTISVAGKELACLATKKDANAVIKTIKERFDDPANGVVGEFTDEIGIDKIETKLGTFKSIDSTVEYLLTGGVEEEVYIIKDGDTIWDICLSLQVSADDIVAANPGMDIEKIHIGDEIKLSKVVPFVHYQTVSEVTADEEIPFAVRQVETDTLYKGETKVEQEGINGLRSVTRQVTKINGEITDAPELSSTPISDPQERVVLMGTKAKPVKAKNPGYSYNGSFSGGNGILADAYALLGVPYRSGGSSPATGFDCSGFVSYVYGINGINLPRSSSGISAAGVYVSLGEAIPGDVVVWGSVGRSNHVGIYVGGGMYIDAPVPGKVVSLRSFSTYRPSFAVRFF